MRFVLFYHSLISDWNHGNAHFLRGVVRELQERGHQVDVYEPRNGWSFQNLVAHQGTDAIGAYRRAYPTLRSHFYSAEVVDFEEILDGADVVIVHEWTDPAVVSGIGRCRARGGRFRLLFHDTHHRAVSEPDEISAFDLTHYDGVLAFGNVLREIYEDRAWAARAWTWHEAADVRLFHPIETSGDPPPDLIWIGNWGDGERAGEIWEYLIDPVEKLGLRTRLHGVRYPEAALKSLARAGIEYHGWLPNFDVPAAFAQAKVTVHIPRRFYSEALPGIPTIRVFEALACAIPLICAPWDDTEQLFRDGDFLIARDGREMCKHLRTLIRSPEARAQLAKSGLETILARHTCAHRVEELLAIVDEIRPVHPSVPGDHRVESATWPRP